MRKPLKTPVERFFAVFGRLTKHCLYLLVLLRFGQRCNSCGRCFEHCGRTLVSQSCVISFEIVPCGRVASASASSANSSMSIAAATMSIHGEAAASSDCCKIGLIVESSILGLRSFDFMTKFSFLDLLYNPCDYFDCFAVACLFWADSQNSPA